MMDVVLPSQDYTVAMYRRQARACLQDIWQRGKLPIVVGGTGLYIQSLLYPMNFAQAKPNPDIREKWQRFLRENGPEALHEQLRRWDRPSAEKLHPNDTKRIIRYLEVFETTGKPFSAHRQNLKPCYRTLLIGFISPATSCIGALNSGWMT
jgi:tRNA dimethylallyltransferase